MKMAVEEVHVRYYTTTWHIKEAKEQTNKSFITIVCMVIYHFTIFQNCDKSKECWVWLRSRVSDYTFLYEAQNNLTNFFMEYDDAFRIDFSDYCIIAKHLWGWGFEFCLHPVRTEFACPPGTSASSRSPNTCVVARLIGISILSVVCERADLAL